MFYSIVLKVKKERYGKYSEAFNFFQSKSINMIIGSRKLDYVVHYRDLEFLDDETEYFKRYYSSAETATRLRKLISTLPPIEGRLLRDQHDAPHSQSPPHPQLPHPRDPQPQTPQTLHPPREEPRPQEQPREGGQQ